MVYELKAINLNLLKKVLILLLCIMIVYTGVQQKKANAMVWAGVLPAGITVGAGAYALGALAVGAVATGLGIEYGDEIKKSASTVWDKGTDLAKDSLHAGLQVSKDAGSAIVNAGNDFWDFVHKSAAEITAKAVSTAINLKILSDSLQDTDFQDSTMEEPITVQTRFPDASIDRTITDYQTGAYVRYTKLSFPNLAGEENNYFGLTFPEGLALFSGLSIDFRAGSLTITMNAVDTSLTYEGYNRGAPTILSSASPESLGYGVDELKTMVENIYTIEQGLNLLTELGLYDVSLATSATFEAWEQAREKVITTDLPTMKDAGLVLPTEDVTPHPAGQPDVPLQWDEAGSTYVLPDGVPYAGDLTWSLPKVRRVIDAQGIPRVVTYVDGIPLDYTSGEPVSIDEAATTEAGGGTNTGEGGGSTPKPANPNNLWMPWMSVLAFVDLLRAIIEYTFRLISFVVTLSSIPAKPIPYYNETFTWYKELTVSGVNVYSIVMLMMNTFLGFIIYRILSKIFMSRR